MPIIPVRSLAKYGVVTDPDPYDLPIEAWSFAVNARFRNGKVARGPVWRKVSGLTTASPRFVVGSVPTTGSDDLFIGSLNGTLVNLTTNTTVTLSGYTPSSAEATWTSCHLADICYINREDRTPWYKRTSDSAFKDLSAASGTQPWNSAWRAKILRASNGALCAYNVTKSGTNLPTMVKTSSFPLSGTVPDSWDQTTPSSNAVENILAEMEGPIVDACTLGNQMFIYGQNECWLQEFVGGTFIWEFSKRFNNRGAINTNCVVEVNRQHYVFGRDDIWVHDGVNQKSICDERTREFIFSGMNQSKTTRCFVHHMADDKTLMFCYVSGDRGAEFMGGPDGCNRAATYDYDNDKWTFDDLPLVYSATRASLDTSATWAAATQTWDTFGGSWQDLEDTGKRSSVFVGDDYSTYGLVRGIYAFDPSGPLSKVSAAVDLNANNGMFLEREGIDLDELGADLRGYKVAVSIYPQGRLENGAQPLQFSVGSANFFNETTDYSDYQTWDGLTTTGGYKLDFNASGRFLAIRVAFDDTKFCSLSGYDVDIQVQGEQ